MKKSIIKPMKKLFLFLTCIGCSLILYSQEPEIDWFGEKGGNGHRPGHSNGNGHRPGHSNGNGHNHDHAPIGTGTTLLIACAIGGVTYKLSKNKNLSDSKHEDDYKEFYNIKD